MEGKQVNGKSRVDQPHIILTRPQSSCSARFKIKKCPYCWVCRHILLTKCNVITNGLVARRLAFVFSSCQTGTDICKTMSNITKTPSILTCGSLFLLVIVCKEIFLGDSSEVVTIRSSWPLCCEHSAATNLVSNFLTVIKTTLVVVQWVTWGLRSKSYEGSLPSSSWDLRVTSTNNYTWDMHTVSVQWINNLIGKITINNHINKHKT